MIACLVHRGGAGAGAGALFAPLTTFWRQDLLMRVRFVCLTVI